MTGNKYSASLSTNGTNRIVFRYPSEREFVGYNYAYLINLSARNNRLRFASFDSIEARYYVSGFARKPYILDITGLNPKRFINSIETTGGYFFDDSYLNREYYLFDPSTVTSITSGFVRKNSFTLRNDLSGADYLAILPNGFNVNELLEHRALFNEFSVNSVYLNDIYDEFGYGSPEPTSIRNYLRYIYENADIVPTYVLLVGDSHFDFLNKLTSQQIQLPIAYPATYYSDDFFVSLDALSGNEMFVGRLPARSQTELNAMIKKIISYETDPVMDNTKLRIVSLSDDEYNSRAVEGLGNTEKQSRLLSDTCEPGLFEGSCLSVEYPLNSFWYKTTCKCKPLMKEVTQRCTYPELHWSCKPVKVAA